MFKRIEVDDKDFDFPLGGSLIFFSTASYELAREKMRSLRSRFKGASKYSGLLVRIEPVEKNHEFLKGLMVQPSLKCIVDRDLNFKHTQEHFEEIAKDVCFQISEDLSPTRPEVVMLVSKKHLAHIAQMESLKSENLKMPERIKKLPKWAQEHIRSLEERVERAEATLPWTEPGMQWFTLLKDSEPETIFLCDRSGTHPIASLGKGDRLFVGRAKSSNHNPE